jgi:hypothetical protein
MPGCLPWLDGRGWVVQRSLPSGFNAVWNAVPNSLAPSPDFHINETRDGLPTPGFNDSRGIDMVFLVFT